MKYRKLPVEIEAARFEQINDDGTAMFAGVPLAWLQTAFEDKVMRVIEDQATKDDPLGQDAKLFVMTAEGAMRVRPGDYVIRGVKGELYPCKPDIFAATYEEVTQDESDPGQPTAQFAAMIERVKNDPAGAASLLLENAGKFRFYEVHHLDKLNAVEVSEGGERKARTYEQTQADTVRKADVNRYHADRIERFLGTTAVDALDDADFAFPVDDAPPQPDLIAEERATFHQELHDLINKHSKENGSDTPDFILANFLNNVLMQFDCAVLLRERWYGREKEPLSVEAAKINAA